MYFVNPAVNPMVNSYKKWCKSFLIIIGTATCVTVAANYLLDPLWCFCHINGINKSSVIIDQRLQKTNEISFGDKQYNAVILGSSRCEPINQNDFGGCKAFNYAVPALTSGEYLSYLDYFKSRIGGDVKYIFIGLDFFTTAKNGPKPLTIPDHYFRKTNEQHYRLRTLFGLDTLRVLIKAKLKKNLYVRYERATNQLVFDALAGEEHRRIFNNRLEMYKTSYYNKNTYQYNAHIKDIYNEIIRTNINSKIVVFVTPESQPLYEYLIKSGRYDDYARWLTDIVQAFGGVYNFMYLNSITINEANYFDADHYYPSIGTLIAHKISGVRDENIPLDFGVYVTKDNLVQHMAFLRAQAEHIISNKSGD